MEECDFVENMENEYYFGKLNRFGGLDFTKI